MKKFGMLLMVLAIVAFSVATSQAALVSLYTMDNTGNNAIGSAPNGSLGSGAAYDAGDFAVGTGSVALDGTANGYFDPTSDALPNVAAGNTMWTATQSLWVKLTDPNAWSGYPQFWAYRASAGANFGGYGNTGSGAIEFYTKIDSSNAYNLEANITSTTPYDGDWHLVTWAYNVSTGALGTGSSSVWIDGVPQAVSIGKNTIDTSMSFTAYEAAAIGSDLNGGLGHEYNWTGNMDDVATFDVELADAQANALYQVGSQMGLNAQDAQDLFDLYVGGGSAVVGGQTWEKYGSGTAFDGTGALAGGQLALGGAGGVQIVPEPGTLSLLLAGAIGLLVFAWRKRK